MRIVSANAVVRGTSDYLGLAGLFTESHEGLAEFTRHVASFECPCSERHLRQSLMVLATDLHQNDFNLDTMKDLVDGLLDQGDLVEVTDSEDDCRLIGLRAPSAFAISKDKVILLGLMPDGANPLPTALRSKRQLRGYARLLFVENSSDALNKLHSSGFLVISEKEWGQMPNELNARRHLASYTARFRSDTPVGQIEGLSLLDSSRPVTHYRSRWDATASADGDFIARRQRKYGNDAWAFVRIRQNVPVSLLDFPTKGSAFRACDEAWHLQQAIDYERGQAQRFRVVAEKDAEHFLEFFSPIPQWAHRRFAVLGEHTARKGCLFSYRFPCANVADEIKFAETRMWLAPL
jgi:hypothetical protein